MRRATMLTDRCGLTLVELLVSISIIAMLLAILLPGIQYIRRQARLADCRSRVRQVALGAFNYEAAHQSFPALYARHGGLEAHRVSWRYSILPFIEEQPMHDALDFTRTEVTKKQKFRFDGHEFIPAIPTQNNPAIVTSYFCPFRSWHTSLPRRIVSRSNGEQIGIDGIGVTTLMASHWLRNSGSRRGVTDTNLPCAGAFYGRARCVRPEDEDLRNALLAKTASVGAKTAYVTDGLSSTMLVYEGRTPTAGDWMTEHGGTVASNYNGHHHHVAMCDGSVRSLSRDYSRLVYYRMSMRNDNEWSSEYLLKQLPSLSY